MTIEDYDFKLEPVSDDSALWDLSFKKIVNKGKVNEREDFSSPLYGLPLNGAIRRIINHRIIAKHKEEVISMKTYFKEYHILWDEILALCKEKKPSPDKN